MLCSTAVALVATTASAVTTLTVDISSKIGPAKHVASGSLYGVTEKLPADVNALIAPLHPNMFTNPATSGAGKQQPVGDAIAVARRVAPTGATVTLRLADWLPGWPYTFTNMTDWLDKVAQTYAQKQASGVSNYYGYEIWNEPDGTWTNSMNFNEFWRQTYVKIRQLDPSAKIIGPSISWYNATYIKNFLTYAKANGCVPDIISWHELSGGNLTSNFANYRSIETQVGVGPLLISINEYSGKDHLTDEGRPGASAPMIAKFERFKVDSACITFWDVPRPGRLGSLLATDSERNGGWWFYKWYGEMNGNMVATTPPAPNDPVALDGFANLDDAAGKATVLFAGVNDGSIRVVVRGLGAASLFGTKVHAVVEHTPFVNRSTIVNTTSTLSTADLSVANDEVAVTVSGTNNNSGYRLSLTPVGAGGSGTGGAAATGGSTATGGSNAGGAVIAGGNKATGGNSSAGRSNASTGGATTPSGGANGSSTGGATVSTQGGATSTTLGGAGSTAQGGKAAVGGANAANGGAAVANGGSLGAGGSRATGGLSALGGAVASGGLVSGAGAPLTDAGAANGGGDADGGGCGCRIAGEPSHSKALMLLGALALLLGRTQLNRRKRI